MLEETPTTWDIAGVANSKYDSLYPKLDWGDGWDDSFSRPGVYAMYHGILGHTIRNT